MPVARAQAEDAQNWMDCVPPPRRLQRPSGTQSRPALGRNICCVSLRVRRRFLPWVYVRLIGDAAAVAAGGNEAEADGTDRNR